ncbi:hypothetical protein BX600DRAFT_482584 [Xylariales sp. PMI_506]|nr:hypothetical protein BX600DRAFT_482584 [Xylariales sp. PMI_506]
MLDGLFPPKGTPPPTVPTDTIMPCHINDDIQANRNSVVYIMFKYDDVLDHEKLHAGLVKLISRDGWRKLGGRMRLNSDGKLEYHVPAKFDESRPAVAYTHTEFTSSIRDHPSASQIPEATSEPTVVGDYTQLDDIFIPPTGAKEFRDYIFTDAPQLGLHIVTFTDATLMSLSWNHVVADGMGLKAILDGWSLAVQGRDDEIPTFYGVDKSPLEPLGTKTEELEPYKLADRYMSRGQVLWYMLRFLFGVFRYPKVERRMVCVPRRFQEKLRAQARQDLIDSLGEEGAKGVFLSESDVLSAWWTRIVVRHMNPPADNSVLLMNAYNLRPVIPDLIPPGTVYVANALFLLFTLLRAGDLLEQPLGLSALAVRRTIAETGNRPQVEAMADMWRREFQRARRPPFFGDSTMTMVGFTNWLKGNFMQLDFSSAVRSFCKLTIGRGTFCVLGKDAGGNTWLCGSLREGLWAKVEETVNELSYDESIIEGKPEVEKVQHM